MLQIPLGLLILAQFTNQNFLCDCVGRKLMSSQGGQCTGCGGSAQAAGQGAWPLVSLCGTRQMGGMPVREWRPAMRMEALGMGIQKLKLQPQSILHLHVMSACVDVYPTIYI